MREVLAVGIGGFFGAIARYVVSESIHRLVGTKFPWGTLTVNLIGCFALGALLAWLDAQVLADPRWRLVVGLGFLGSLTTFSTFGAETVELVRRAEVITAVGYVAGSVVIGCAAVLLGASLARWLTG